MAMPGDDVVDALTGTSVSVRVGSQIDLGELDAPVRFHRQARPLPAEQRVAYRLATLALTLSRFRGATASVEYLHLLGWAIRTRRSRSMLQAWWSGRRMADTVTERLDPNLPVTLNLARVHDLVRLTGTGTQRRRVALTQQGAALAARVEEDTTLLRTEKAFLAGLEPLNDARIARVLGGITP
jgi:hypothetical protein